MSLAQVLKLTEIARKPSRLIIGLMSGTSLDGLDIALCRVSGSGEQTVAEVLEFETRAYEQPFIDDILQVFAKKQADLEKLCLLNAHIAHVHARYVLDALNQWGVKVSSIDCIASHGQTIYHAPKRIHQLPDYPNATLQIGDGDHLAVKTGILTISDFRQKPVAMGGEGAPLAAIGDRLLFSSASESRFLLNIGGIANFTFLPAVGKGPAGSSTDTGPGNTLIDTYCRKLFNQPFDRGGRLAAAGRVSELLLGELLEHPFFREELPKSTGPELFNAAFTEAAQLRSGAVNLSAIDLLATLTRFTAVAIARAISAIHEEGVVYVSGGGAHNPVIMTCLKEELPGMTINDFTALGLHPDAKEALLFAVLANETLAGEGPSAGKVSFPG